VDISEQDVSIRNPVYSGRGAWENPRGLLLRMRGVVEQVAGRGLADASPELVTVFGTALAYVSGYPAG